jgi:hypothetical protein
MFCIQMTQTAALQGEKFITMRVFLVINQTFLGLGASLFKNLSNQEESQLEDCKNGK